MAGPSECYRDLQLPWLPALDAWNSTGNFNQSSGALHNNLFFALRIDGAVLPESIVGGVEPSQDKSPGIQNPAMPVGTSLVFPVAPGEHTVSLVVTIGKESGAAAYTNRTFIESRELIVLEMRR